MHMCDVLGVCSGCVCAILVVFVCSAFVEWRTLLICNVLVGWGTLLICNVLVGWGTLLCVMYWWVGGHY